MLRDKVKINKGVSIHKPLRCKPWIIAFSIIGLSLFVYAGKALGEVNYFIYDGPGRSVV